MKSLWCDIIAEGDSFVRYLRTEQSSTQLKSFDEILKDTHSNSFLCRYQLMSNEPTKFFLNDIREIEMM